MTTLFAYPFVSCRMREFGRLVNVIDFFYLSLPNKKRNTEQGALAPFLNCLQTRKYSK